MSSNYIGPYLLFAYPFTSNACMCFAVFVSARLNLCTNVEASTYLCMPNFSYKNRVTSVYTYTHSFLYVFMCTHSHELKVLFHTHTPPCSPSSSQATVFGECHPEGGGRFEEGGAAGIRIRVIRAGGGGWGLGGMGMRETSMNQSSRSEKIENHQPSTLNE